MTGNITELISLVDGFTGTFNAFVSEARKASLAIGELNEKSKVLFGPGGDIVWKDMGKAVEGVEKNLKKAGGAQTNFFKSILGSAVVIRGYQAFTGALRDGIHGALQAEMVNTALVESMRRLNDTADPSRVLAYYEGLAKASGTSDESMKQAATNLQRMAGLSQGVVAQMMKGMMGAALSSGERDAGRVASAIGTALVTGSARALKDYGIQIEDSLSMEEQIDAIIAQLKKFESEVDRVAGTAAGRAYQIAEAWDEAKESMGAGFLEAFRGSTEAIDSFGASLKVIGTAVAWLARGATAAFLSVGSVMTSLTGMAFAAGQGIGDSFNMVVDGIASGWTFVKDSFNAMWKEVLERLSKGWNAIADTKLGRKMGLGLIDVGELEKESEEAGKKVRQSFDKALQEASANSETALRNMTINAMATRDAASNVALYAMGAMGVGTPPVAGKNTPPASDKRVLADMSQRDQAADKMKSAGDKMKDAADAFGKSVESMFGSGGTKASQETAQRYQERADKALRHRDYDSYAKYSEIAGRAQYGSNYDQMRERGMIEDPYQKARDIANFMDFGVTPDKAGGSFDSLSAEEKQARREGKTPEKKGGKSGGKGDGGIGEAVDKAEGKLDEILPKLARFIEEIPERLSSIETALQAAGITG